MRKALIIGGGIGGTATSRTAPSASAYGAAHSRRLYLVRESGETCWFANLHRSDEPTRKELAAIPTAQWQRQLRDLFADDLPVINEIVTDSVGDVGAHLVYDIPTSPVWHRGPALLIGDAVHATSPSAGQGVSMAVEDAVILARCLRDAPDTNAASTAYEQLRRPRVERVVAYSKTLSNSKTAGPVARVLRDLMMPIALKLFAGPKSHSWMYTHHIDWNEKVAMHVA
ncbi:monooxygenase [Micromonospora sp. ATCC 39149]|uniref:FAD-dependent oxidoreductase n=1 Tax=Micromonospora sp. (strain ATCC 39149 / NRRL 15099 / SCC 1413) TaxID=219305 RepID=UPI0001A50EAB|nr:FAD-dependent monooxygenase [Micromonospora sp. ATCC 39149]EEP71122.1 monooxygenase [Micromonospora sp. ATCC 39149]